MLSRYAPRTVERGEGNYPSSIARFVRDLDDQLENSTGSLSFENLPLHFQSSSGGSGSIAPVANESSIDHWQQIQRIMHFKPAHLRRVDLFTKQPRLPVHFFAFQPVDRSIEVRIGEAGFEG